MESTKQLQSECRGDRHQEILGWLAQAIAAGKL